MRRNLPRLLVVIILVIQLCDGLKNCSYRDKETQKIRYNTCADNMVCCENSHSMLDACCPDETYYVAPIDLSLKNILFVLCLFFGIIFFGAIIITIMMSISSCLTKEDAQKRSNCRSTKLVNYNSYDPQHL